jgi:rhomboid protease GluP
VKPQKSYKWEILVRPYLILISTLLLLNWAVFRVFNFSAINSSLESGQIIFLLCFSLFGLGIYLFFRKRLGILDLDVSNGSWYAFYIMIMIFSLLVPQIFEGMYLERSSHKLININSAAGNKINDENKFYSLEKYFVQKKDVGYYSTITVTGKRGRYLLFDVYISCPLRPDSITDFNPSNVVFYGKKYSETHRNNIPESEQRLKIQALAKKSMEEFSLHNSNSVPYFENAGFGKDFEYYEAGILNRFPNSRPGTILVLMPQKGTFEGPAQKYLLGILISTGIGAIVWILLVALPPIDRKGYYDFINGKKKWNEN